MDSENIPTVADYMGFIDCCKIWAVRALLEYCLDLTQSLKGENEYLRGEIIRLVHATTAPRYMQKRSITKQGSYIHTYIYEIQPTNHSIFSGSSSDLTSHLLFNSRHLHT